MLETEIRDDALRRAMQGTIKRLLSGEEDLDVLYSAIGLSQSSLTTRIPIFATVPRFRFPKR